MLTLNSELRRKYFAHDSICHRIDRSEFSSRRIFLHGIGFIPFRTTITPQSKDAVRKNAIPFLKTKVTEVSIYGQRDKLETGWHPARGSLSNWRISKLRAEVTRDFLISLGFLKDIIQVIDSKDNDPIPKHAHEALKDDPFVEFWKNRTIKASVLYEINYDPE
jgi:hypothetical protein